MKYSYTSARQLELELAVADRRRKNRYRFFIDRDRASFRQVVNNRTAYRTLAIANASQVRSSRFLSSGIVP